ARREGEVSCRRRRHQIRLVSLNRITAGREWNNGTPGGYRWHRPGQLRSVTSIPPNDTPRRPSPLNELPSLPKRPNARTNSPPAVARSTHIFCQPSGILLDSLSLEMPGRMQHGSSTWIEKGTAASRGSSLLSLTCNSTFTPGHAPAPVNPAKLRVATLLVAAAACACFVPANCDPG